MEQLSDAIEIDGQQQQQQQQPQQHHETNAIVSDISSLTDNGIKVTQVTDPQGLDDFEPNQKWEITTLEKASYDCSDMYLDTLNNQNPDTNDQSNQPDAQRIELEPTNPKIEDRENGDSGAQTQDNECHTQVPEQVEQPRVPEPREEKPSSNLSAEIDNVTTTKDQQQAEPAFNSYILSQASVDAQMEKVIDNIVELGGCQPYTNSSDQPDSIIDKDREVEHIQREIIGESGPPTEIGIQKETTIPEHEQDTAKQEERFDCDRPSLPDDSQQLPDLKLTQDIVPDEDMLTSNLEVKDLIPSEEVEAKLDKAESKDEVEPEANQESKEEVESMPEAETHQEVNNGQTIESKQEFGLGHHVETEPDVDTELDASIKEEVEAIKERDDDLDDQADSKVEDDSEEASETMDQVVQEKKMCEESGDKQPEGESPPDVQVEAIESKEEKEEDEEEEEESVEETRPTRSTRSRATKRSLSDETKKPTTEKRQSKRTRFIADETKEKEQIEKPVAPPAAKSSLSTVRTLSSRHTISTSAPSTHSESRYRSTASTRDDSGAMYSCEHCKYSTNRLNNIVHHKKIACEFIKKMFEAEVTQFKKTLQSPKGNKKRR